MIHRGRTAAVRSAVRTVGALALVAALLLTGCGSDDEPDEGAAGPQQQSQDGDERVDGIATRNLEEEGLTPQPGGSLAFGIEAETDGWNPVVNRWALSGHYVASAIYDTLVTLGEDGQPELSLAESLEHNEDATEWTLKLRPDVRFHDGSPLTAEVIVAGFQGHKGSPLTGKAYLGLESMTMPAGPDGLEVVFHMNEPWATFPYTLMGQAGYVIPLELTRDLETIVAGITEPAGTGPFKFVSWTENESTVVTRNDDYWRDGLPYLDEITFYPIDDGEERASRLASGELDLMMTRTPSVITRAMNSDDRVVSDNDQEENLVLMNHAQEPFDDLDARKAVVQAVDTERFASETGRDEVGEVARGPFAPGGIGYDEDDGYLGYDLEAAKAANQRYQDKTGSPVTFEFITYDEVEYQLATQVLVQMWTEAGIVVTPAPKTQSDSVTSIALGSFQAAMFRMYGNPNPDTEFSYWHSRTIPNPDDPNDTPISLNWGRFSNPTVDEQLERSRGTFDLQERHDAMTVVARTMNEEAAFLWLDRVNWTLVANTRVNGLAASTDGTLGSLSVKPWLAEIWVG